MKDYRIIRFTDIAALFTIAIFLVLTFILLDHVEYQGFNPSDDGVVLAQSWRIVNGEAPHKDFISIRPVGSGVLHSIHFYTGLPLMVSARWFVLLQFFVIGVLFSLIIRELYYREYNRVLSPVLFYSIVLTGFGLSVLNYNMYPWTTIDAVFWSVFAMFFLIRRKPYFLIIGLVLLSFAALSRQNFAILTLFGFVYVLFFSGGKFLQRFLICILGGIPFILYFLILLKSDAVNLFVEQMTGRTELLETGILQFGKRFFLSFSASINVICLFICALLFFGKKSALKEVFVSKGFASLIAVVYGFIAIVLIVRYYLLDYADILGLPFELFYMLAVLGLLNFIVSGKIRLIHIYTLIVLLIGWTSAISLGDNSPVFSTGIIALMLFFVIADFHILYPVKITRLVSNKYFLAVLSIFIFVFGVNSQRQVNYRDNSASELVYGLNYASSEFGGILTNPACVAYYSDLADIFESLPSSINRTVVIPNNAIFYPIFKTINPVSLDWLQADEYVGQEGRLFPEIRDLIDQPGYYFVIDKVDSKLLNKGLFPMVYEDGHISEIVFDNCHEIEINSDFFMVFISKE
jgi:hypothetical protein